MSERRVLLPPDQLRIIHVEASRKKDRILMQQYAKSNELVLHANGFTADNFPVLDATTIDPTTRDLIQTPLHLIRIQAEPEVFDQGVAHAAYLQKNGKIKLIPENERDVVYWPNSREASLNEYRNLRPVVTDAIQKEAHMRNAMRAKA